MTYTDIVDGYQIRDVTYIGLPPKDTPPRYDIVRHVDCEPFEAVDLETGKRGTHTHYVYSVGVVEWNRHEEDWDFRSVGTRWLVEKPSEAVVDMVLAFCEEKGREIRDEDD